MAFIVRVFFSLEMVKLMKSVRKKKGDTVMLIEVTMHLQF